MMGESVQENKEDDESMRTCLHVLAAMGQLASCKAFVDSRPKCGSTYVNCPDSLGWTPLMYAARFGHYQVLKFLHSIGASFTSKNIFDYTTLCMAVASNSKEVFEYVMEELQKLGSLEDETIAFELACVLGRTDFLKSFLSLEEFDVNTIHCSLTGINPLLLTVYSGKVEAVELLLANGAKPPPVDDSYPSALDIAAFNQDAQMKAVLVKEKLTLCLTPTLLTPSIDTENLVFNFSTPPPFHYNLQESGYRLNYSPKHQRDTVDCSFHRLDGLLSPRFLKPEENRRWLDSIENKLTKTTKEPKTFSRKKYISWMSQKINKRRAKSTNDICEDSSKANLDGMERTDCILTHILTELKLEKYIAKFKKNEMDHFTVFTLTEGDLIALGILKKKERLNILESLEEYKSQIQHKLDATSVNKQQVWSLSPQ
ncbi:uncharacterized protein LOC111058954 isoform X2 [Nilaparvata lugens]|uniref:uncharacterized protein LOC111058954 isoform X2 n=1 Tax=Nilaparvata lugens TaxID=108931 RepID=UPI00193CDD74|nr:uncharacterized protein LOC111058954 isoform X2 [Nilaparvata lugens]